jgi:hypothetical protein
MPGEIDKSKHPVVFLYSLDLDPYVKLQAMSNKVGDKADLSVHTI